MKSDVVDTFHSGEKGIVPDATSRIPAKQLHEYFPESIITMDSFYFYGFNRMYCKVFVSLREMFGDLLELDNPEGTSTTIRRHCRILREKLLFNPERYLAGFVGVEQDFVYVEAMRFIPHWEMQWFNWSEETTPDDAFDQMGGFNDAECDVMQNKLPRRTYLIHANSKEERRILLGLLDILFAYCYDHRMNAGEENVESAFNIAR